MTSTSGDESELSKAISNCIPIKAIESLYLNSHTADVHFTFKSSDERIPAHKSILAVSEVFKTAFFGSIPEKDEVKIEDEGVNADAFKEFLQFFYLKEVKLSMKHIKNVMYLGKKYQMDDCLIVCSSFLKENLTIDETCMGLQLALYYEQDDLKEFCLRQIAVNTEEVLKSDGFLNCDWNVLSTIVRTDTLNCSESSL